MLRRHNITKKNIKNEYSISTTDHTSDNIYSMNISNHNLKDLNINVNAPAVLKLNNQVFPSSNGTANQILSTDGNNTLSWNSLKWTTSGNNIYSNNSGYVGILQSNPTTALDVNGTIKLNNHLFFSNTNNQIYYNDNNFKFMTNGAWRMTIGDTGNVGIGDTSPSYKLDVDGDINLTGSLRINDVTQILGSPWTVSGNNIYNDNSGNVGIGQSNPSNKLDVNGDLFIRGSNIWVKNNADTGTRLRFHHSGNDAYIDWYTGKFHIRYDTTSKFTFTSAGNFGILQTNPAHALDVNGTIKLNNHLYFTNSNNRISWSNNYFNFMTNGAWRMTIGDTGNVGINDTSPSYKLDVTGDINLTGSLRINGVAQIFGSSPWTESGNTLYWNVMGNVGIGTNNPPSPLFIRASSNTSPQNNAISVFNSALSPSSHAIVSVRVNGSSAGDPFISYDVAGVAGWSTGIDNSDSDKFKISNAWDNLSSATKLTITTGGYIGILQSNPTHALDVNGSIKLNNWLYFTNTSNAIYGGASFMYFMVNGQWRMELTSTGKLAVGGTGPQETLDVHGDIYSRGSNIWLKNNANSGQRLRLHHNGSNAYIDYYNYLYIRHNGGGGIFTLTNSYVGIHNTSPNFPLHVSSSGGSYSSSLWGYHHYGSYWGWANYYGGSWSSSGYAIGLRVDEGVIAKRMYIMSDERIKKDIVDIVDNEALVKFRQLKPKKYKYKNGRFGDKEVYGFIAQEVESIIPNSCNIVSDYIPNIQLSANITSIEETSCILTTGIDNELEINDIICCHDNKGESINDIKVIEIIDTKTIKIDKIFTAEQTIFTDENNFTEQNIIFIYGKKVDDFHNLNKDSIWTIATAALQEVDRQLQAEKAKVATLEQEIATIKSHLGL